MSAAVAQLKRQEDGQLLIMGSATLIHSLLPLELIDEYRLAIYPLMAQTLDCMTP